MTCNLRPKQFLKVTNCCTCFCRNSTGSSSSSGTGGSSLSGGAIAGIVVGALVGVGLIAALTGAPPTLDTYACQPLLLAPDDFAILLLQ